MNKRWFRLTNARIASQVIFFVLFLLSLWATWTTRIFGYPVSRFLELNPLVSISTFLSSGVIYRALGWSLIVIVLTFLFGRVFCNWVCPLGTLNQFIGWIFNINKSEKRREKNRYRRIQFLKYSFLIAFLFMALLGSLQIGLLDPIATIYRSLVTVFVPAWDLSFGYSAGFQLSDYFGFLIFKPGASDRIFLGAFWIGLLFTGLITASFWYPRFFCRILCPTGAFLGILSRFALFRINRDVHKCTDCDLCLTRCEGASDPQSKLRLSECLVCMNCLDDCPEDAISYTLLGQDKNQVIPKPDFSRRELIFAGVMGVLGYSFLKLNGKSSDEAFSPKMIRPPGSMEESVFLEKCIKCEQCLNICPTNVLQPAGLVEGGIEALWTPVLNFNIAHCQQKCTLCSEVCPTGAIRKISVAEKMGKGDYSGQGPVRLGTAFIDTNRCLPWANEIPCVVCEEVCPVSPKAIQTKDVEVKDVFGNLVLLNKPFIVPDLCIGCGICQSECPVVDKPAVYVTAIGETRSQSRQHLLKYRYQDS